MVKRGFTLIEILFVLIIITFLIIGAFEIIGKIYKRNFMVTKTSEFEFLTQQTLDQISGMIYYRVPLSVIGYNYSVTPQYKYIGEITEGDNYTVLEWIGEAFDAKQEANLSGFIDLYASDSENKILVAKDFNKDFIKDVLKYKFNTLSSIENIIGIIFAGSFDRGEEGVLDDYENAFGWHGGGHNHVFTASAIKPSGNDSNDSNITLNEKPNRIYAKFYLADSAYAIARFGDLNKSNWNCGVSAPESDDTLLFFYNYRPWKGETFCGDGGVGDVTVLAENVKAFKVKAVNEHLELKITMKKIKDDINITVSKQKAVF